MDHLDHETPPSPHESDIELIGLPPPLSPRSRARRLAVAVAVVALCLVVVIASIPTVRQGALTLLTGPTPTPTPYSLPGASSFYFMASPPWVTVLVDGRPLRSVPLPTADGRTQPLRLARGSHTFEWRGAPFLPLHCQLTVPLPLIYTPHAGDCPIQPYQGVPAGYVLTDRESLATLPPTQQDALRAAIAAGLHGASASAVIQPGESYLGALDATRQSVSIRTAGSALRGTVRFTSALASDSSEPCDVDSTQQCRFPDQDCRQLCDATLDLPAAQLADRSAWFVAVPVHANWYFSAPDGTPVSQASAGVSPDYLLAVLHLIWDGASWYASPDFGDSLGGSIADDTVCAPSRDWIEIGVYPPLPGPLARQGAPQVIGAGDGVMYTSGPDPTDGCLLSIPPTALAFAPDPPLTQPATFLFRFGILLAVNAAARQVAPRLPVADTAEQAIAQRLQAQPSGS